jgi:hypothetical protein
MTGRASVVVVVAGLGTLLLSACSSGSGSAPLVTSPTASVQNLVISDFVRAQLLLAESQATGLPRTAFAGLSRSGERFSYDSRTKTFWAGAQLVASSSSPAAKQAVSGRGSYLVFSQAQGKAWKVYQTGSGGCSVTIPAPVLTAWGWPQGTYRP